MEITSPNNELVKETVKLQQKKTRVKTGKFLLEGYKVIKEAVDSKIKMDCVFVLGSKKDKYNFLDCEIIETTDGILKKISTTESAPEAVGVGIQKISNTNDLKKAKKAILLENISDAGNLGTIVRTAAGFGIDAIILFGDTVDPYNPKCVRSAVGNLWKTDIYEIKSVEELDKYFSDFERVATLPKSEKTIWLSEWKPKDKTLIMFGSEADGLSEKLKEYATENLTIEMRNTVESLNLSISAGIVTYFMRKV